MQNSKSQDPNLIFPTKSAIEKKGKKYLGRKKASSTQSLGDGGERLNFNHPRLFCKESSIQRTLEVPVSFQKFNPL